MWKAKWMFDMGTWYSICERWMASPHMQQGSSFPYPAYNDVTSVTGTEFVAMRSRTSERSSGSGIGGPGIGCYSCCNWVNAGLTHLLSRQILRGYDVTRATGCHLILIRIVALHWLHEVRKPVVIRCEREYLGANLLRFELGG